MDQSMTLINAQIQFLDTRLALVHIPLLLYPHFIQPILKLLALVGADDEDSDSIPRKAWSFYYPFTNISVTTTECSIVCPRHLIIELFTPLVSALAPQLQKQVSISRDDFVVIQVGGEGIEAGQRVLDLTAPLALAGISIYFITSYYSDFILVPQKSRHAVVTALEEQGFAFEPQSTNGHSTAYNMTNVSSPLHAHHRNTSSSSCFDEPGFSPLASPSGNPPSTPPATSIAECTTRTFATLRRANIYPVVDRSMTLATCAGHRGDRDTQTRLSYCIINALVSTPRFISITLTEADSVSLTLEQRLLDKCFPNGGKEVLLMAEEAVMPIMLDLRDLPDESTGIVCGVAGRLIERMKGFGGMTGMDSGGVGGGFSMSYLSTAKAGHVIVLEDEVEDALEALREFADGGAVDGVGARIVDGVAAVDLDA